MRTHNEIFIEAPLASCLEAASDVERWPDILEHYSEVRFTHDRPGVSTVLMRARRDFGPVAYPIWWESEMEIDEPRATVRYRHVRGVTTGMEVEWRLTACDGGTRIVITHEWTGPRWPIIGRFAAGRVIGPHFVHVVADRTLAGIKQAVEAGWSPAGPGRSPAEAGPASS